MWHAPKKELGNILSLQNEANQSTAKQTPNPKPKAERTGKDWGTGKGRGKAKPKAGASNQLHQATKRPTDQKAKWPPGEAAKTSHDKEEFSQNLRGLLQQLAGNECKDIYIN